MRAFVERGLHGWTNGVPGTVRGRVLGDRGIANEGGNERFDLRIRLDLELLPHDLLIPPRVIHRSGAISGGGECEHEPRRRAGRERIGVRERPAPRYVLRHVPGFGAGVSQTFDARSVAKQQACALGLDPRLELVTLAEMESVEKGPLYMPTIAAESMATRAS